MAQRKKIPAAVKKALAQGVHLPQAAEVVSHFMAAAGGPKGLVRMMLVEFDAAKPGSLIRQRILDSVLRMIGQANQDMGGLDELDMQSNEDLERELSKLLTGMPDGQEEASAAGPQEPATPGKHAAAPAADVRGGAPGGLSAAGDGKPTP